MIGKDSSDKAPRMKTTPGSKNIGGGKTTVAQREDPPRHEPGGNGPNRNIPAR
jgi:hypothetical protein